MYPPEKPETPWSPDGKEIFYRDGRKMMAVSVQEQPNLRVSEPWELFEGTSLTWPPVRHYDLTLDGQRFVMVKRGEEALPTQINVVLNWTEELKRLVPTETLFLALRR